MQRVHPNPTKQRQDHTCTVQTPVDTVAAREGVGNKFLSGQVWAPQVPARQLDAADHQLARHAHRHQLQMRVQHIAAQVGDRLPDRHSAAALELGGYVIACKRLQAL